MSRRDRIYVENANGRKSSNPSTRARWFNVNTCCAIGRFRIPAILVKSMLDARKSPLWHEYSHPDKKSKSRVAMAANAADVEQVFPSISISKYFKYSQQVFPFPSIFNKYFQVFSRSLFVVGCSKRFAVFRRSKATSTGCCGASWLLWSARHSAGHCSSLRRSSTSTRPSTPSTGSDSISIPRLTSADCQVLRGRCSSYWESQWKLPFTHATFNVIFNAISRAKRVLPYTARMICREESLDRKWSHIIGRHSFRICGTILVFFKFILDQYCTILTILDQYEFELLNVSLLGLGLELRNCHIVPGLFVAVLRDLAVEHLIKTFCCMRSCVVKICRLTFRRASHPREISYVFVHAIRGPTDHQPRFVFETCLPLCAFPTRSFFKKKIVNWYDEKTLWDTQKGCRYGNQNANPVGRGGDV